MPCRGALSHTDTQRPFPAPRHKYQRDSQHQGTTTPKRRQRSGSAAERQSPVADDIVFKDESYAAGTSVDIEASEGMEGGNKPEPTREKFPPAIIEGLSEEQIAKFKCWLDENLEPLIADQLKKQTEWAGYEKSYRGKSGPGSDKPYVGSSKDTVPAIAMAVDPIHARLDTGIFKQDPVFQFKPLKKSFVKYTHGISNFINYYQKHKLKLRSIASPRILEMTKLGSCVFKTVYDRQSAKIKSYKEGSWEVQEVEEVRYSGPRVFGISLGDFLFPPLYQHLQDCPIVAERQRTTYWKLKVAEASGKLVNVDQIKGQEANSRTDLEAARETAANHVGTQKHHEDLEVYEVWCDYDIDGNGLPEHLVATYHRSSRVLLQLRYNWYFHQRKPYTLIPYQLTNDSLYGIGICEMVEPFQEALTKWHRMATDNAYLANIRMFIVKKESGIEDVPRLYAGRCFFVDDPKSDFIPFASGDIYPSTLAERQNIFGLVEKRTGVSDYLTGRESPIIGSRATATSTLALIQEGTKRVEEVLENIRSGMSEVIENCLYIWIQYGTEGLDDLVFGDDETGALVKEFFDTIKAENVNGALAIDLTATDASGNRQAVQQMQLQIIQVMMQYLEKLLAAGQGALQAQQTMPQMTEMIKDVMTSARNMFRDLLQKYDIRNPDDYLPDLEKYLGGQTLSPGQGIGGNPQGGVGGLQPEPNLFPGTATLNRPGVPQPAAPGVGGQSSGSLPFAGSGQGI